MTDWTLPDAMVEDVARAIAPKSWKVRYRNGDTGAQLARRTASLRHARAALAASPIGELAKRLAGMEDMIANSPGVPSEPSSLPQMLLHEIRAALARARGETK